MGGPRYARDRHDARRILAYGYTTVAGDPPVSPNPSSRTSSTTPTIVNGRRFVRVIRTVALRQERGNPSPSVSAVPNRGEQRLTIETPRRFGCHPIESEPRACGCDGRELLRRHPYLCVGSAAAAGCPSIAIGVDVPMTESGG